MTQLPPQALIYIIISLIFISFLLAGAKGSFWRNIKSLSIWLLTILLGTYLYGSNQELIKRASEVLRGTLMPGTAIPLADNSYAFKKALDGHFHIIANINNVPIEFLVDTGASDVTLSMEDALKAGIDPATLNYTKTYNTANGQIKGAEVQVNVAIETVVFPNFTVTVNSATMDKSLMGMALLSKFDIKLDENDLTLTQVSQ
jgi:aspartyl protease family protein